MSIPKKITTLTLSTALAALLAAPLVAQEDRPGKGRKGPKGRPSKEAILKKFDANNDGKLSQAERDQARAAAEARRAAADADGNGEVSAAERLAAFKTRLAENEAFATRVLEKFDADESGDLSDDELAKAVEAGKRLKGARDRKGGKDGRRNRGPRRGERSKRDS